MNSSTNQGISVLMPVKNAEKTIVLALKSTLRAMNKESEIIILLDSCTDSTEGLVRGIHDPRIRIISSPEPLGVARALNRLASEANFEILARMDADDVTLPWRFKTQIRALSKLDADFVFPSHLVFGDPVSPRLRPSIWCKLTPADSKLALCISNPFIHAGALMKRDVFERLGGYNDCPAEDYDLWIRAALSNYSICRIATPGILVRLHRGQVTRDPIWQMKLREDPQILNSLRTLRDLTLKRSYADSSEIYLETESSLFRELMYLAGQKRFLVRQVLKRNLRKVSNG